MKLSELAKVVRSKNAGPFMLTLDIIVRTRADYDRLVAAKWLDEAFLAQLYHVELAVVKIHRYPVANAVKVTFPRSISAGSPGDSDILGAQQHVPLLSLEV